MFLFLAVSLLPDATDAFLQQPKHLAHFARQQHTRCDPSTTTTTATTTATATQLQMSNKFDVTKPVFDLFSLRSVRGDALTKYSSLNQSEPLRINIWALAALTFFSSPWLAIELNDEALPLVGVAAAVGAGFGSTGLFIRECQRRSKQLSRLEKELNALALQICLPTNQLADYAFQQPRSLSQLMNKSSLTVRLLAFSGTASELKKSLIPLRVLGRRLVQASTFVVVVPTDQSSADDFGLPAGERLPFVGGIVSPEDWNAYFASLGDTNDSSWNFRWFGISASGRSFGSGQGTSPEWLQILGQHLRPTDILSDSNSSQQQDDKSGILSRQRSFYQALIEGNLERMNSIYGTDEAEQVSRVMEQGGRLDEWKSCLEEDARPTGMQTGDADVVVISDTLAYSTIIEFPVTTGLEGATLLAVQTWTRVDAKDEWKLSLHETIPWSADRPAGGILLCDRRGCVALTRGPDRRTFGGLVG